MTLPQKSGISFYNRYPMERILISMQRAIDILQTIHLRSYEYNYACVRTYLFFLFTPVALTIGHLYIVKERKMALETKINPVEDTAASHPLGTLHFGSNWRPTSPKFQELVVRHQANHGALNNHPPPSGEVDVME